MNDILIIDNLFTKKEVDEISNLLSSEYFPWFFNSENYGTVSKTDYLKYSNKNTYEYLQLYHSFVYDGEPKSPYMDVINFIINKIQMHLNEKFDFTRIKANFQTKVSRIDENQIHSTPHVDSTNEHLVFLYYVNDSDGKTFFYENQSYAKNITKTIESKGGRVVMFDGSNLHCGSHPNEGYRMVINFNCRRKF